MKKLLMLAVCALLLVGCTTKPTTELTPLQKELLDSTKLILGTSPDYPPFESLNTAGELEGFEIDMMNEVIKIFNEDNKVNLAIEWKTMDFSTIIGALQANQIDVGVSGFTYDPARDVYFVTPHIISQQVVVVQTASSIKTLKDLEGKKIAASLGTTGETAAKNIASAEVVTLNDFPTAFANLKTGAVDAVVADLAVAENYAQANGYYVVPEALIDENMSLIVSKTKANLQTALDAAVEKFMASTTYQDLLVKWELK
jgi:arginine/lysine/histidine transporter system substrate-binding protein